MTANAWELRADVAPLETAAVRWEELSALMTRRGDEIVTAARRATEGWDAVAAESYDNHRRQVLVNLDRFTTLATQIAGSLRAISSIITASQAELDQAWTKVAMIPHEVVGESRYLVFRPSEDEDRGKVTSGELETEEIRGRMSSSLEQESTRLRSARAELVMVRTELKTLAGGFFPGGAGPDEVTGVGSIPPATSTSVPGSAQAGVSALPPLGAISVSMPDLQGVSGNNIAPFVASAASGLVGRRGEKKPSSAASPMGGMGAGAMGARAGSMSRGMASGRSGPTRLATPRLEGRAGARGSASGGSEDDEAARLAREKEAAKEAKRAALEEKRAERAARRAERERDKDEDKKRFGGVPTEEVTVGSDAEDDDPDDGPDDGPDDERDDLGEVGARRDGGDADAPAHRGRRTTPETGSGPGVSRR